MKPTTYGRAGQFARAFILLSLLLTFVFPVAHAQEGAPPTTDATEPDRITTTSSPQGGIYYLDYGGTLYDPATYPITGAQRVVGWQKMNPADGVYDWSIIDQRITDVKAKGLKLGVMTTVYDGNDAGDIRSTPDYVIKTADAVIPANNNDTPPTPNYVSYWKRSSYNANFDYSNHSYLWTVSGNASIVDGPDSGTNYAAKLGGTNNASGYAYHYDERIPAMPASLNGTKRVYINADVYIDTADTGANDHLYMELWGTDHKKISGSTAVDISNLAHTNKTWKTYTFDVSNFGTEKTVEAAFRVTTDGANATTFYVDNVQLMVRHLIPNYESNAFSDAYVEFIQAFGARYKSNADLQYVSFGTGVYGENQPTQDTYDYVVKPTLTSADWIAYINKVTQAHADAFTAVPGQAPSRSLMLQYAPTYISVQEHEDTTDYAGTRKVGLSSNFLSPDWTQAFKNDGTGIYDPLVKYGGQVPMSFEAYGSDLCNPVLTFVALAQALDKKIDYQRVDGAMMSKQADKDNINWAKPYFGKTAETTAKVWVLMREHRNPTLTTCRSGGAYYLPTGGSTIWPDLGNFDFYLKQVDSITGGKTVAETNDKSVDSRYARDPANLGNSAPNAGLGNCPTTLSYRTDLFGSNYPCFPQPYNPDLPVLEGQDPNDNTTWYDYKKLPNWTGNGKEAYTVRRTDQATSNPYMFFLIDDGYIPGTDMYSANITVKYFDIGTDKWSLKYDSTSGEKTAGTVTKTGTKTLKTATFTVTDGRFGGRLTGGADFYIDSRNGTTNDGNEWIHMVEVERTSPLSAPKAPAVVVAKSGADAALTWAAVTQDVSGKGVVIDHYDVWRSATAPYFAPNTSSDTPYGRVLTPGFTDPAALSAAGGYFYLVTAVNSASSALSNRTGAFSYDLVKGQ